MKFSFAMLLSLSGAHAVNPHHKVGGELLEMGTDSNFYQSHQILLGGVGPTVDKLSIAAQAHLERSSYSDHPLLTKEGWKLLSKTHGTPTKEKNSEILDLDAIDFLVNSFPDNFTWRDAPGHGSLVTKNLNQHIPKYCGGCWAHGAMSALADRVKISRKATGDSNGPEVNPSIQAMINCGKDQAGSCKGGSSLGAWSWTKDFGGIPFDTCMPYLASQDMECSGVNLCRNCMGKIEEPKNDDDYFCYAIDKDFDGNKENYQSQSCFGDMCKTHPFPTINVRSLGTVVNSTIYSDEKQHRQNEVLMMLEIATRGPIACELDAGPMMSYTGGVLSGNGPKEVRDHVISVAGWGVDEVTGEKYWEIRNSWGEYWGEEGWMRLIRGVDEMGIEDACFWVVPDGWGSTEQFTKNDEEAVLELASKSLLMKIAQEWGVDPAEFFGEQNLDEEGAGAGAGAGAASGGMFYGILIGGVLGVLGNKIFEKRANNGYSSISTH